MEPRYLGVEDGELDAEALDLMLESCGVDKEDSRADIVDIVRNHIEAGHNDFTIEIAPHVPDGAEEMRRSFVRPCSIYFSEDGDLYIVIVPWRGHLQVASERQALEVLEEWMRSHGWREEVHVFRYQYLRSNGVHRFEIGSPNGLFFVHGEDGRVVDNYGVFERSW
jgi:hypothetical protein